MSALRERHEEATRLNQELQRKCWEQLGRSPPRSQPPSRPTSGGMTTLRWQTRLMEREEELRGEMRERERGLLEQISETESRLIEREGAWQAEKEAWHAERAALLSQVRWGYVDVLSWTPTSGLVCSFSYGHNWKSIILGEESTKVQHGLPLCVSKYGQGPHPSLPVRWSCWRAD